jgi:ABC-type Fe3+-hydroxamate transport system substrate-binding protein
MENGYCHSMRLAAFLYKLEKIQRLHTIEPDFRHDKSLYGMLYICEAEGGISINGSRYSLRPHKVFIFAPDSRVRLAVRPGRPTDGFYLQFQVLQAGKGGHYAPVKAQFPEEMTAVHFPLILDKLRKAEEKHNSPNEWDVMEANIRFQETISDLFRDRPGEQRSDPRKAIHLARDYIEQNYRSNITREMLAEMAGLNADYFSRAFKRQFGKSPIAYLNDIRIRQAKRMLVQSGEPIRSVAQNVGFSDEFYFSRKFKSHTGCSPAAYVKRIKDCCKLASLNHLITGHMIALGLEPYAAIINSAFPVAGQLNNTIAIGQTNPDLEKLVKAKPDLIVTRGTRYSEKSPKEIIYEQIAPTITLSYSESWRSHFQTIARIVGKSREAEDWLARYESKADAISRQIKSRAGDETFLILGIGEDRFVVYGQRNIGTVLYGDLKLSAPEGVKHIGHYKEIEPDELLALEADRILLTIFRNDGTMSSDQAIRKQLRRLHASKQWRSLRAVRSGKVYGLCDGRHLYTSYNPLSHDLLLDKLRQLLAN